MARLTRRECLEAGMLVQALEFDVHVLEDALYTNDLVNSKEAADILSVHAGRLTEVMPSAQADVGEIKEAAFRLVDRLGADRRLDGGPVTDWHDEATGTVERIRARAFLACSEGVSERAPKEWMPREPRR